MLLFNIFNNKFDNFINTSNKENVINYYKIKNVINPWLSNTGKNKVADNFQI